jgi:hypothetical protein
LIIFIADSFVIGINKSGLGSGEAKLKLDHVWAEPLFGQNINEIEIGGFTQVTLIINLQNLLEHLDNLQDYYAIRFGNLDIFNNRRNILMALLNDNEEYSFQTQVKKFNGGGGSLYIEKPNKNIEDYTFLLREINLSPKNIETSLVASIEGNIYNRCIRIDEFTIEQPPPQQDGNDGEQPPPVKYEHNSLPYQLILQGPPGTGKSHTLDDLLKKQDINPKNSDRFERIVGHPELTSADFIGQYRPVTHGSNLEYRFTPGPFARLLKRALDDEEKKPHILVIEELNRTNAAAMFAEVFQLLDRDDEGYSQYGVNLGIDVNRYLLGKEREAEHESYKVRLPPNFALWATMNTADQGVFPMDTAFKRRWSFKYLGVDEGHNVWNSQGVAGQINPWNPLVPSYSNLYWQTMRVNINQLLAESGIDEDRQLGGFFLTKRELGWDPIIKQLVPNHEEVIKESIMTKVVGYLRDDVLRYEPHMLFKDDGNQRVKGFSALLSKMKREGVLSVFKGFNNSESWNKTFAEYIAGYAAASVTSSPDRSNPPTSSELEAEQTESE